MKTFDETDPDQVLACEEFVDLFTGMACRMLAHDLYRTGRAAAEIRRTAARRIVGLNPIDATTIIRKMDAAGIRYEQHIPGRPPIQLPRGSVLYLVLDRQALTPP